MEFVVYKHTVEPNRNKQLTFNCILLNFVRDDFHFEIIESFFLVVLLGRNVRGHQKEAVESKGKFISVFLKDCI